MALELYQNVLSSKGQLHEDTLQYKLTYAIILYKNKGLEEADSLWADLIMEYGQKYGEFGENTVDVKESYANLLHQAERHEEEAKILAELNEAID